MTDRSVASARTSLALGLVALFALGRAGLADDGWDILSGAPTTPPTTSQAIATSDAPASSSVAVAILATPLAAESGDPYVSVVVELRGSDLLRGTATGELQGRIEVKALDAGGAERAALQQPFLLTLDEETRARLGEAGLKLFSTVRIPPGSYRLTASVVAGELQARGQETVSIEVPDLGRGTAYVSPALVPHGLERWKAFQQSQGGHPEAGYAYVAPGGAAFLPAARPALPAGQAVDLYLIAYGSVPGMEARLLDEEGRLVARPDLTIASRAAGDRPGEERIKGTLAPLDLPRGAYVLEIAAGEARSRIPIEVVTKESSSVDAAAMVAARVREEEAEIDLGPIDPRQVRELQAKYAEIVSGLEGGDFDATARQLAAFENAVFTSAATSRAKSLKTLRKAQTTIADELVRKDPDGLVPLLYLHFLADEGYRARGDTWTVAQNRAFLTELVQIYTNRGGRGSVRLGAQFLATVGAPGRALEIDAENSLAILRVGLGLEKSGQYRHAVPHFQRLVELRPGELHARLRLAVNLRRMGERARARELFQGLIASEAPTWIRLIAYQELADLEVESRRPRAAESLLRQGIEETGDQSLLLQLAYLLDRGRRRDDAIAVLNQVTVDRGAGEASARHRYNGQPVEELAAARAELLAAAREGLPALRTAMTQSRVFTMEVSP